MNADIASAIGYFLPLEAILAARLVCAAWSRVFVNPPIVFAADIYGYCIYVSRHNVVISFDSSPGRCDSGVTDYDEISIISDAAFRWSRPQFTHSSLKNFPLFPELLDNSAQRIPRLRAIFGAQVVYIVAYLQISDKPISGYSSDGPEICGFRQCGPGEPTCEFAIIEYDEIYYIDWDTAMELIHAICNTKLQRFDWKLGMLRDFSKCAKSGVYTVSWTGIEIRCCVTSTKYRGRQICDPVIYTA